VGAEEVDLSHEDGLALDSHVNGDSRDKGVECSLGLVSDADNPLGVEARGVEGPLQEGGGVVESEFTIIVFNVMVYEQLVKLLQVLLIAEVDQGPFVCVG